MFRNATQSSYMELLLVDAAKGDPGRKGPVGSAGPPGRRAGPPGRRGRTGQIGLPGPKGFGGRKGDTGNQGQIKTSICFCVRVDHFQPSSRGVVES